MPGGRALVAGLVNGSQVVIIGPTSSRKVVTASRGAGSLENADGSAGTSGGTTIRFDADLTDTSVVVFDASGAEIAAPMWSNLGHELIHAEHQRRRAQPPQPRACDERCVRQRRGGGDDRHRQGRGRELAARRAYAACEVRTRRA